MNARIEDGGPAFPCEDHYNPRGEFHQTGMTLRDWVAGQCVSAAFSIDRPIDLEEGQSVYDALREHWTGIAGAAFIAADAFIAARKGDAA